jgi:uncharacterized protein (DUF2147 family)
MLERIGNGPNQLERLFVRLVVVLGLTTASITAARPGLAASAEPVGKWYAEGGAAVVEIGSCGDALCGRVVWLRSPLDEDGCELRDKSNPDPSLRNRRVVGLQILDGLVASDQNRAVSWTGGTIYDPVSGNSYRCRLELDGHDRLQLRGYIGIPLIGRTATWTRVGSEKTKCTQ